MSITDQTGTADHDPALNRLDQLAAKSNLSRRQLLVWISQQLNPGLPLFNMIVSFRIDGPIDTDRFSRAFHSLVGSTDALRTVIEDQGAIPRQRVLAVLDAGLERVDLSAEDDPTEAFLRWVGQREKQLDLSRRLFDSALITVSEECHHWYLNLDHLITDAWSFSLIYQRMERLYRRAGSGSGALTDEGSGASLLEHCRQEKELSKSGIYVRARKYWEKKLAGRPSELQLYGKRPEPLVRPSVRVEHELDQRRSRALRELGQRDEIRFVTPGATSLCLFSAIFAAYLHRVSGESRLSMGIPFHNRRSDEAEQVVGPLMEICPALFRFEGGETFLDLYRTARAEVLGGLKYSQFSLANPVHGKIYNVTLNYFPASLPRFDGFAVRSWWISSGYMEEGEMMILQVEDRVDTGQFLLHFDFNAELFSETARRWAIGHFLQLLDGFTSNPDQAVQQVDILSAEEYSFLGQRCRGADSAASGAGTVVRLFEQRAAEQPDAAAVEFQGERLTYGELNRQANRLAHRLRRLGVGREEIVGLVGERSIASILGLLGILKAGGTYFPLPPQHPDQRLLAMVRDAGLKFLIEGQTLRPGLQGVVPRVLSRGGDLSGLEAESDDSPEPAPQAGDSAYLLYTSGTTGVPNGFLVEHRSWENYVVDGVARLGLRPESRMLQFASLGFDLSLGEIGLALGSGATLVMETAEELVPGPELIALLRRLAISHLITTPPALSGLTRGGLPALEVVAVAGDKCTAETARRWSGEGTLFNSYGPAETTIVMTYHRCGRERGHPPLGRPIPNTFFELLDDRRLPVPLGVPGELYIGGVCLAREYLGNPELTAEKFVNDRRPGRAGVRLFKSGDMARFDDQGELEFIGRRDRQVKVRGNRAELEEIERACTEIDGVIECAVLLELQGPDGEKALSAYFTGSGSRSTLSLRRELRGRLPGFMVPAKMIQLEHLPRTGNRKIDYAALGGRTETYLDDEQYQAPGNEVEEVLAGLWAELLGLDRVGIHDRYFDLGGDSLSAMQIIARARARGISFSIKDIFRHQTIAELAGAAEWTAPASAGGAPVVGQVPLSPIQQHYFDLCREAPENSMVALTVDLAPEVTAQQVNEALCFVVDHHDALRMRYIREGDRWVQECRPPGCRPRFRTVAKNAFSGTAGAYLEPFNLSKSPLLQALYVEAGAESTDQVFLFFHHLVIDAYSLRILLDDLERLVGQLQLGQSPELPLQGDSFKEWSERLQVHARSKDVLGETEYWSGCAGEADVLAGDPAVNRGPGCSPSQLEFERETMASHLDQEATGRLLASVDCGAGASIQPMLLCALWAAWFGVTGRTMLYLALEDHGRRTPLAGLNVLGTIGWFTAVYPFRLQLGATDTLSRLRETGEALAAVPGRGLGYGLLRYMNEDPVVRGLMEGVPEPGVAFNFLGHLRPDTGEGNLLRIAGDPFEFLVPGQARRLWPLQVEALIMDGRLRVRWNGLRDVLGEDQATGLVTLFEEQLADIARCLQ